MFVYFYEFFICHCFYRKLNCLNYMQPWGKNLIMLCMATRHKKTFVVDRDVKNPFHLYGRYHILISNVGNFNNA